jgi:hypothetical protein
MNNSLKETMCARMSNVIPECSRRELVPETLLETDNGIDRKVTNTLEEVRDLLKKIRSGTIGPLDAAKTVLEISNTSDESYQALRYLEDRLKIVRSLLSEVESTLAGKDIE